MQTVKTVKTVEMAFELCPCLDALFPGVPDETGLRTLAELGVRWFEFWDWRTHDLAVLARASSRYGLRPAVFSGNTFTEPLLSAETRPAALAHLRASLEVANRLGTGALVVHVGYAVDSPPADQWRAAADGLRAAGTMAVSYGTILLVEPLNSTIDHPGYFLDALPAARSLVAEVDLPSVRLLLDVYHMRVMHADLLALLPEALSSVGHVHVADVPGRHEPGTGTIPWPTVIRLLGDGGYRGLIGLEYWPSTTAAEAITRTREAFLHSLTQTKKTE